MKYLDSVQDFFKSPRWLTNLLVAGLCGWIPVVGPMVVLGWLLGGFWGRDDTNPATFPDFKFDRFAEYLKRGLWPMLVGMLSGFVIAPVMWVLSVVPMLVVSALGAGHGNHESGARGIVALLAMLVMFVLIFACMIAFTLLLKPLMLRASLLQDFGKAFDFRWCLRFVKLTWLECVLTLLFLWVVALAFELVGLLALCIGVMFILAPIHFAWVHLDQQLYKLFVQRGGEPLPLSPSLRDGPPSVPIG